ncbi:transposase [Zavarzinella formosa]|uniref:transposase n=1 Tax=Zavarzinella formosa TaxID=360055 RepID=UPI00037E6F4E
MVSVGNLISGGQTERPIRSAGLRKIVNALLYLDRTGWQWELLPNDCSAKIAVYDYFLAWRGSEDWRAVPDVLREVTR